MKLQDVIACLKADKEYLTDNKICDGEEIDIAINAIKKEITEKVIDNYHHSGENPISNILYQCPACRDDLTHVRSTYCPYCGQKLDWSEEKYEAIL